MPTNQNACGQKLWCPKARQLEGILPLAEARHRPYHSNSLMAPENDIARVDARYERLDLEVEDEQYLKRARLDELGARKIRLKTVRWQLFPSSHIDHRLWIICLAIWPSPSMSLYLKEHADSNKYLQAIDGL